MQHPTYDDLPQALETKQAKELIATLRLIKLDLQRDWKQEETLSIVRITISSQKMTDRVEDDQFVATQRNQTLVFEQLQGA